MTANFKISLSTVYKKWGEVIIFHYHLELFLAVMLQQTILPSLEVSEAVRLATCNHLGPL